MTEIALRDTRMDDGYLVAWAESARAAAGIAQSLARTPFVPASLRHQDRDVTVGNITAAILTGRELGLTPMSALRSIDVIQGTPTLRAIALRALVLAAGHEIVVAESNSTRAIVRGRRKGSDEWQTSTWTTDRAKTMGLLGRDQWKAQPTSMLVARATAECARLIAADVLLAIPYISEEIEDRDGEHIEAPPVEQAPRRTAQRRTRPRNGPPPTPPSTIPPAAAPPEDEPPLDDDQETTAEGERSVPAEADSEPAPDMITAEQLRALQAGFTALGIRARKERLDLTRQIIGRDVESANGLYRREASTVIDELRLRKQRLEQADEDAQLDAAFEADQRAQQQHPTLDDDPSLEENP
jgi:hypothetical protein